MYGAIFFLSFQNMKNLLYVTVCQFSFFTLGNCKIPGTTAHFIKKSLQNLLTDLVFFQKIHKVQILRIFCCKLLFDSLGDLSFLFFHTSNGIQQFLRLNWFRQIILNSIFNCSSRITEICVSTLDDHAGIRKLLIDFFCQLQTVHIRHSDIGNHNIHRIVLHKGENFCSCFSLSTDFQIKI